MEKQLVSMVKDSLTSYATEEAKLIFNAAGEAENLSGTFKAIEAVLDDAEKKQVRNPSLRDWLGKLKVAAYDVEDVLDEWETEKLPQKNSESESERDDDDIGLCNSVRNYISSSIPNYCKSILVRREIAHKIKEINARLAKIDAEKTQYHLIAKTENEQKDEARSRSIDEWETSARKKTSPLIGKAVKTFGRDEEKNIITNKLVSESGEGEEGIPVVAIVGAGGLGKTTLSQLVYNDEKVKDHFNFKLWVFVPKIFKAEDLMKAIIKKYDEQMPSDELRDKKKMPNDDELESLQICLRERLAGRKFLLLLDDVWNANNTEWTKLSYPIEGGDRGSKILVTTRDVNVANVMRRSSPTSSYTLILKTLPENDCWSLFSSCAFAGRTEESCKFEMVGRAIVEKCKGSPLALTTVASALNSRMTIDEWELALNSEIWEIEEIEKEIMPALLLSYSDLRSDLKRCFAYCAVLRKGQVVDKDRLIKLWMAQGFISQKNGLLEEQGESCFNDLLGRSFFQHIENEYKMHDLVHSLAQFVLENRNSDLQNLTNKRHYLEICDPNIAENFSQFNSASKLPKFLYRAWIFAFPTTPLHPFIRLRALRLQITSRVKLSEFVNTLKHLRYLDLSKSNIEELPESICINLCNLQTLDLSYCMYLQKLPTELWKMSNLRHLNIENTPNLNYLPKGIGKLSGLRTLSNLIVGDVTGLKIGELKNLNLLRGKLDIRYLSRVAGAEEAKEANLEMKKHLVSLTLLGNDDTMKSIEAERMTRVLESLQPHPNLENLNIWETVGFKFPSWMNSSLLTKLVKLHLNSCHEFTDLPALGKFPVLKHLTMVSLSNVKHLGREFYGVDGVFPKLEVLKLANMISLKEWELRVEDGEMPCLHDLEILHFSIPLPNRLPDSLRKLSISVNDDTIWASCFLQGLEQLSLRTSRERFSAVPCRSDYKLKYLEISWSKNLIALPEGLGKLKSLEVLKIFHSYRLKSLPEELQELKALRELNIGGCTGLRVLLQREAWEEWYKIAHIPRIRYNHKIVQWLE